MDGFGGKSIVYGVEGSIKMYSTWTVSLSLPSGSSLVYDVDDLVRMLLSAAYASLICLRVLDY
jgi:hypothetical protein